MSYTASVSISVRAPVDKVWDALTKPELVKKYFFGTNLDTDWRVGAPVFFRGEWQGKSYEDRGTVLSFEPMKSLSYNYCSAFSGLPDEPSRRQIIRFDLAVADGAVSLTVVQSNVDSQQRADHSAENWKGVLEALKKLVEE